MEEDRLTLAVEEANTKLIEIINEALLLGYSKAYSKTLVIKLIADTMKELEELGASDDLILSTKLALEKAFMKEWLQVIIILKEKAKNDELGLIGQQIARMTTNAKMDLTSSKGGLVLDIVNEGKTLGIANAQINNIRDFITDSRLGGTSKFVDYRTMISNTLMEVKDKLADGSLTLTDSLGRVKSIRNMAEIQTRYQMINQDMERQGVNLNDLVIASSHEDASERCSWWQGKIFLMDLDISLRSMGQYKGIKPTQTILGYVDGKPYYSLLQACENGFLSFNCQHRLIKYYKGASPVRYDMISVKKARNLTIRQRQMENTIRHWKRKERLSSPSIEVHRTNAPYIQNGMWYSDGVPTGIQASEHSMNLKSIGTVQRDVLSDKDYSVSMTNFWNDKYAQFSRENDLPEYRWRTRITEYEAK